MLAVGPKNNCTENGFTDGTWPILNRGLFFMPIYCYQGWMVSINERFSLNVFKIF